MVTKLSESIVQRLQAMKDARLNHNTLVQEVYDFIDPTNGQVIVKNADGYIKYREIYDYTAIDAYDKFIGGMYANFTPADQRWVDVGAKTKKLKDSQEVSLFFNDASAAHHEAIVDSNFPVEIQKVYADLGIPGRAAIICLPGELGGLRYKSFGWTNTWIAENEFGVVDTLFIERKLTARNALNKWGNKVSKKVRDAAESNNEKDDKFCFIQAIFPRTDRNPRFKNKENMPWASIHVESETKEELDVSGFHEQPFACPRFYQDSLEVEGRSAGQKVLETVKMIMSMALTHIKKGNWDSDPPILLPDDDLMQLVFAPGKNIPYNPGPTGAKPEFLTAQNRYDLSLELFNKQETAIRKGFFNDLFALFDSLRDDRERTAFEIQKRLNEKVGLASPMRGKQMIELFQPLNNRSINLLQRQGRFGDVPREVLEEPGFNLEYKGPLAILSKALSVQSTDAYLESIERVREQKPDIVDNIDYDELSDLYADVYGVPSTIIIERDVVNEGRAVRAQQIEQERQVAMAAEAAKAVPALQGQTQEGSPLAALGAA